LIYLLDVNLLIALAWPSHIHHRIAQTWFRRRGRTGWATCPITQTGFVRISSNSKFIDGAVSPQGAIQLLERVMQSTHHTFWPDDLSLAGTLFQADSPENIWTHVVGHRQVTDAYLLSLAREHQGKLATLDQAVPSLISDVAQRKDLLELLEV
jgi:hypothetical protein